MRKAATLLTIVGSLLFSALALATIASADPGGNNGDVKIHDTTTAVEDHRNEPHVCSFYIDGFNFDARSNGTWRIERWAPTGSGVQASGTWGPADGAGNWHSATMTLPDGHYKLFFKQTGTPGGEKQKVFWVECNASAPAGSAATPTPAATGATGPTGASGSTGATGTSGSTGATGTSGSTGATGAAAASTPAPSPTVAGFQQNNSATGAVTPIVELPGGSNQQSPNTAGAVNGVQTAPSGVNGIESSPVAGVQSLPSTSTGGSPTLPLTLLGLALMGLGGALLRDPSSRS